LNATYTRILVTSPAYNCLNVQKRQHGHNFFFTFRALKTVKTKLKMKFSITGII